MQQFSLLLFVTLFLFSSCQSENKKTGASLQEWVESAESEKITQLKEIDWPKAYASQDTTLLDRILHDEFEMIDGSGRWYSKSDEIDWITNNKTEYDSFRYQIKRLDFFKNNTAIVSGTGHIINKGKRSEYQSSNVLIFEKERWQAISSHVSGYKELD